jgi:hypothetical protein
MRFESRVFKLAKDPEHPEENQDACLLDAERGIAAIADGVASGIFARQWARILTEATVAETPDPADKEAFARWLARRREAWSAEIDVDNLAWFQKPKLRQGAFSTLLWVEIAPIDPSDRQPQDPWRLRVFAVGDSCLFHQSGLKLLRTFPIEKAEELEADPVVIGSVDLNRDGLVEFQSFEALCRPGDLLALSTDAVAEWAFRLSDAGNPPHWEEYWSKTEQAWQDEVTSLRSDRQMRYDDATLLLLRITDGVTAPEPAAEGEPPAEAPSTEEPAAPLPLSNAATQPEGTEPWTKRLGSLSEQVTEQLVRGTSKLKEKLKGVRQSAESTIRKYRDKLRSDDQEPPPEA